MKAIDLILHQFLVGWEQAYPAIFAQVTREHLLEYVEVFNIYKHEWTRSH